MRLREWALSTSHDGARSRLNCQYLDALLHHGSHADTPGSSISVDQTAYCGIPCLRVHFQLPRMFQATGVRSIPVLVPNGWTGIHQNMIFYSLIEELIRWMAGVGPTRTLVRLYRSNHGQELARSYLSAWHELNSGFVLFITSLRDSPNELPGLGQLLSGALGYIEVSQARSSSHDVSPDYIVTITLNNRRRVSLFLPRAVAQLPQDWLFDWLEVQIELQS